MTASYEKLPIPGDTPQKHQKSNPRVEEKHVEKKKNTRRVD